MSKSVETFYANIWLGRCEGYDGKLVPVPSIRKICKKFVEKGLCVTITETEFVYTGGNEPGVIIGLINYPRFPSSDRAVMDNAYELANILMRKLDQFRCTIVTPRRTFLLENDDKTEE